MKKILISFILLNITLFACTPILLTPSPEDVQTAIAATLEKNIQPTETVRPTKTKAPAGTATTQPSPTITPSGPYSATINAAYLNLRTGPSTFFDVLNTYVEGDAIQVIARTPDNEWVYIETEDDFEGWMATTYLALSGDPSLLPLAPLSNVDIVQGYVEDTDGNPISGINIAISNREGSEELRTNVYSDIVGKWMAIIPADIFNILDIQIVGVRCDSSIMNDDCVIEGHFEILGRAFHNLPSETEVIFKYGIATRQISGIVLDINGDPAGNILVVAERDDGAENSAFTNDDGSFTLAADSGVWDVYTVNFDNGRSESDRIQLEITDTDPKPLELGTP